MTDAPTIERITHELELIRFAVEELTGLSSRWNGVVELIPNADFRGTKPFSCILRLNASLASEDLRWRTLIHESLHAVSAGYFPSDFQRFLGWEEGVVEQLQRLLRSEILAKIGVVVDEAIFAGAEREHAFNPYIAALESIRQALNAEDREFYLHLLQTPIKGRHAALFEQAMRSEGITKRQSLEALSIARVVLEK